MKAIQPKVFYVIFFVLFLVLVLLIFFFGYFVAVVVVYCFLSLLQKCVNFPNKPVLNPHQSLDILRAVGAKTWLLQIMPPNFNKISQACPPVLRRLIKETGNGEKEREIYLMWPHLGKGSKRRSGYIPLTSPSLGS